jgi:hypothetical protein
MFARDADPSPRLPSPGTWASTESPRLPSPGTLGGPIWRIGVLVAIRKNDVLCFEELNEVSNNGMLRLEKRARATRDPIFTATEALRHGEGVADEGGLPYWW